MHHYGWMLCGQDTFLHWVLVAPSNLHMSEGCPGVLKLRFIQLDDLKMGKMGVVRLWVLCHTSHVGVNGTC
jgi:hypothetical protein